MDRQRLARVFAVLSRVAERPSTLSEIGRDLGLPVSSTHDLLQALLDLDAVSVQDRRFTLGPRAVGLAYEMRGSTDVVHLAARPLEQVAQDTRLDAYIAVRAGTGVVYAARQAGSRAVNIDLPLGRRIPLHASAAGKLFAALEPDLRRRLASEELAQLTERTRTTPAQLTHHLDSIAASGISVSRGEEHHGLVSVAVPVLKADKSLAAALSVSALEAAASREQIQEAVAVLRAAADIVQRELARRLGNAPY